MARKLDNIDLDMIDADRLGYGVHYGHFKMDHPFTKEANESRLKKKQTTQTKSRMEYVFNCPTCGKEFTTPNKARRYCSDLCKGRRDRTAYKAKTAQQ